MDRSLNQPQKPYKRIALTKEVPSTNSLTGVSIKAGGKHRRSDGALEERPTSVPRLKSSSNIQQAWDILLAHGMSPNQVDHLRSRAITESSIAQNESLGENRPSQERPLLQDSSHTEADYERGQTTNSSVGRETINDIPRETAGVERSMPQVDNTIVQDKEQRLMVLVSQIINEIGPSSPTVSTLDVLP